MTRVHSPEAGLIPTEGHGAAVVSGHTSGPWFANRRQYESTVTTKPDGGYGDVVATCRQWSSRPDKPGPETALANARLIAAAPDYAAAAEPLARLVEFFGGEDRDEISVTAGELRALAAAHAKATGETGQ